MIQLLSSLLLFVLRVFNKRCLERGFPFLPTLRQQAGRVQGLGRQRNSLLNALFLLAVLPAVAQNEITETGRIESEFKLDVPAEISALLWDHLIQNYTSKKVAEWDSRLTTTNNREVFYDTYFDTDEKIMLQNHCGVRFRQRFLDGQLAKELVQLKLPTSDSSGVVRMERKYDFYDNKKKSDRQAMHAFWKYIHPKDRDEINLHLAPFGIQGNELTPVIKVEQDRRRIYFQENEEALLTITLDEVSSFYFPYPSFTEMELELNEIRYTNSDDNERQRLEALNTRIKNSLLEAFPMLQQDQTPKYNKMYQLVQASPLALIYQQLQYIILTALIGYAGYLFFTQRKITSTTSLSTK